MQESNDGKYSVFFTNSDKKKNFNRKKNWKKKNWEKKNSSKKNKASNSNISKNAEEEAHYYDSESDYDYSEEEEEINYIETVEILSDDDAYINVID